MAAKISARQLQFAVHKNQLTKISRRAFVIHPSTVETEDASHRHTNAARASGQRYWSDMCWKSQRVLGEADGAMKYATGEDLFAEKRREDDLRRAGWIFVRWTWQEAVVDPFCFVSRLSRALGLG